VDASCNLSETGAGSYGSRSKQLTETEKPVSRSGLNREAIIRTYGVIQPFVRRTPVIEMDGVDYGLGDCRVLFKLDFFNTPVRSRRAGLLPILFCGRSLRRVWSRHREAIMASRSPTQPCGWENRHESLCPVCLAGQTRANS
jgi:hypothetical protein